jgi:phage tail-like protein
VAVELVDPGARPFTTFRFLVEVKVDGIADKLCGATFSEVDGLEMTMEPKTFREGGNNTVATHFVGPVSYGQLTLKRGMTQNFDLWKWFSLVNRPGYRGVRARVEIVVVSSDGTTEDARFVAEECLPTKLKAPVLNAREGQIAIEEMQIVYQSLTLRPSSGGTEAPKLAKATLQEISWTKTGTVEPKNVAGEATQVEVQFNPATLKVNYSNQKAGADQPGGSPVQFVGKGTTKLTLELVFDTTILEKEGPAGSPQDVRTKTQEIFKFMKPMEKGSGKKKQFIPPGVRFQWGSFLFDGVVDSMDENLEFFSSSGVPLRATVSLALSQQDLQFQTRAAKAEEAGTNPFEEARAGDSVQQMAAKAGNSDWKGVALANGIENPRLLAPGTLLNMSATGVSASLGGSLGVGGVAIGGASFGVSGGASIGAGASFGAGGGVGAGIGAGGGFGASAGADAFGAGASASASVSGGFSAEASASGEASIR